MEDQTLLLYLAGVPVLGVAAQWLAWRVRMPSILLLLGFGLALGAFVNPDELLARIAESRPSVGPKLLFPIISLSVAVILFEGGLTLRVRELKEAGQPLFRLVTFGALISWLLTSLAAWLCFGLDRRVAALIGAILVVTGPTVIGPMLRHIRPSRRVGSIVKWEGIVIDPIGAILAVLVFEQVFRSLPGSTVWDMVWVLAKTVLVGGVLGAVGTVLLVQCMKRYWIPDYLHGVTVLAVVMGTFALSNYLQHESGLVTVTVLGIMLANQRAAKIHHIIEFKEQLGVFLISCLFIVLGSRLNLGGLAQLGMGGAAFLLLMILVVRPASVFLSTLGTELNWREKLFISCLAPRGIVAAAVASVFALKLATPIGTAVDPGLAEQADKIVAITFLVIIGTVSVYGLAAPPLARWLGMSDPGPQGVLFAGAEPWVREVALMLHKSGISVLLVDTNFANVAKARMEGLRAECVSILSEHVREEIDLAGIGRLLAMTANDEVNALAVGEFAHLFGQANVYQLPPSEQSADRRTSVGEHLRGRLLFDRTFTHDRLEACYWAGCTLKKTQLSATFTYTDFVVRHGDAALPLFLISEAKKLVVFTADKRPDPRPNHSLIFLLRPRNVGTDEAEQTSDPETSASRTADEGSNSEKG